MEERVKRVGEDRPSGCVQQCIERRSDRRINCYHLFDEVLQPYEGGNQTSLSLRAP